MSNVLSHSQPQSHFKNLLETQAQEIVKQRKLLHEYEKREKQCIRKWNALLAQNLGLQEQLNGVNNQIQRQKSSYSQVIAQQDRKLVEAN